MYFALLNIALAKDNLYPPYGGGLVGWPLIIYFLYLHSCIRLKQVPFFCCINAEGVI